MGSVAVFQILAIFGFAIVLVAFLVITKTVNTIGICLLRMEYLLKRELDLVRERERIKLTIMKEQAKEEERRRGLEEEADPLLHVPFVAKKEKN